MNNQLKQLIERAVPGSPLSVDLYNRYLKMTAVLIETAIDKGKVIDALEQLERDSFVINDRFMGMSLLYDERYTVPKTLLEHPLFKRGVEYLIDGNEDFTQAIKKDEDLQKHIQKIVLTNIKYDLEELFER